MAIKTLAKDTLIYGLGEMTGKLVFFISFPIVATVLSAKDFGTLDLLLTTGNLLGIFVGCGLNNAISRYYWDEDTKKIEQPTLISTGLFLQVIFGLSLIIIAIAVIPYIFPKIKYEYHLSVSLISVLAVIILIPITQWVQYMKDVLRLHLAPWKYSFVSIFVKVVASISGVIAVVYFKFGIDGFLLAQVITLIIAIPVVAVFIKKDLSFKLSYDWTKKLLGYGTPFIYVGLAYWIFGSIDRWMLAYMSSVSETGVYSIAARFSYIILFASMAFGQAWSPYAIKIKTDNPDTYRQIYAKIFLILIYIMLLIAGGISIISKEIITILLPDEYLGAIVPLSILCFSAAIQSTQQITGAGISIAKKTKIFGYMAWITAILNIVLNYFLIPYFGANGAAFATLLSYTILTISYIYYTQKFHPLPFDYIKIGFLITLGLVVGIFIYIFNSFELSFEVFVSKIFIMIIIALIGLSVFKNDIVNCIKTNKLRGNTNK